MFKELTKEQKKRGLSDSKLARMADINQSDFCSMKNGKRPCYPAWRKRISSVLGVPEDELFPKFADKVKAGA